MPTRPPRRPRSKGRATSSSGRSSRSIATAAVDGCRSLFALPRQLGEKRRQVLADDLGRRPPERLDARGARACRLRRRVCRYRGAPPVSSRPRRTGRKGCGSSAAPAAAAIASAAAIGLLRRDPALLDREPRDVARRVDVFRPSHAAVGVDGMNPSRVCGTPSIRGPDERRERDHAVGLERLRRQQAELAARGAPARRTRCAARSRVPRAGLSDRFARLSRRTAAAARPPA